MGKKKVPPPLTKRFNNGHKCLTAAESEALIECQNRVDRARDNFYTNVHLMKRNRNCTAGEATSREDAPPLIPHDRLPYRPGEEPFEMLGGTLSAKTYNNPAVSLGRDRDVTTDQARVQSLRKQSSKIDSELNMMREILRHKQFVLQLSHNGKRLTEQRLHPAMQQTIEKSTIQEQNSIPYIG